jgi:hypothetical protein
MLDIRLDTRALERDLNRLTRELPQAIEAGLDASATRVLQAKSREVGKTYARPIPRGKNGKPKWKRSGAWREGQTVEKSVGTRTIRTQGKAEKYEPRLANLPTGADGANRTNKAADEAFEKVKPQLGEIFSREVENHLRLNG